MMEQRELDLFGGKDADIHSGPVTCLGMTFDNDEARRAHFTEELRKKLQDPEFRKIEGFPIGRDEDILNLSDPPYYTACPNPWIADFIEAWEREKPRMNANEREYGKDNLRPLASISGSDSYHREPFAADVSEGKNDPIYNAHSYHTKVPHKAIMRYILHYTQPGDIVFDGMYFLPDQLAEYDRKKMHSGSIEQAVMFVKDEATAIQWLHQLIKEKPQTFQDINPQFMQQLGGWSKNEAQLDLRELLHQNFLSYDGKGPVPEQIHAYLSSNWKELRNLPKDDPALVTKARDRWYVPDPNKAGDLEKLREKALLKEFEEYKEVKKKLKVFRLEAVRVGFKKAWQERDYTVIVAVADKIPNNVLEEDPKLLMWYDQAVTRMGGES